MFWHIHKIPSFIVKTFPSSIWHGSREKRSLYLTFDDGPIPEITPWVLDLLKQKNIKASFFCVGDNMRKYPTIVDAILNDGHMIGNHTFNHLSGWTNSKEKYLENVALCQSQLEASGIDSKFFRPPYGRIKPKIKKALVEEGYQVVMWDVLTYDFDPQVSIKQCLHQSLKATENGSIIVFHDSVKSERLLKAVLPSYIDRCLSEGFKFEIFK